MPVTGIQPLREAGQNSLSQLARGRARPGVRFGEIQPHSDFGNKSQR